MHRVHNTCRVRTCMCSMRLSEHEQDAMSTCTSTHMSTHTSARLTTHMSPHTYLHTYLHTWEYVGNGGLSTKTVCTCAWAFACVRACMSVRASVRACLRPYMRARMCVHVRVRARTCMYRCLFMSAPLLMLGSVGSNRWPHCTGGRIAQLAILHRWPYCTVGHIAQVAILHTALYARQRRFEHRQHPDPSAPRHNL